LWSKSNLFFQENEESKNPKGQLEVALCVIHSW
jgi:hypothetical protein